MPDGKSVPDEVFSGDDRVAEALSAVLRRANTDGKDDEQLARLSGVKASRIKSYRLRTRHPSLGAGLAIAAALGDDAVNALLHFIRYQASPLEEPGELQPSRIVGDALSHLAVIGQAAADNRIDHTEWPATEAAADQLIATVLPLSSARRGK